MSSLACSICKACALMLVVSLSAVAQADELVANLTALKEASDNELLSLDEYTTSKRKLLTDFTKEVESDTFVAKLKTLKAALGADLITTAEYDDARSRIQTRLVGTAPASSESTEPHALDQDKGGANADWVCTYVSGEIPEKFAVMTSFTSDSSMEEVVSEILRHQGLQPANFTILPANVPNAVATIQGGRRYILYRPGFIQEMKTKTGNKWAAASILAHEIGHHLNGHTNLGTGSRPDIELEADEFSGFALCRMKAKIDDAMAAIRTFPDEPSVTHPGRPQRLEAIQKGWRDAEKLGQAGSEDSGASAEPVKEPGTGTKPCVHRIPCVHPIPCTHIGPCVHTMPCSHMVACQHIVMGPFGPGAAHPYDTLHMFDTMHPADTQHVMDTAHPFDLQHPEGDP
ncbi:MAG: hypothetical protein RBU21_22075 [FCB group bacterium]|jgi:hypothetical protein|nr:hypothetical protein [FCB group bacterium]